jgi:hypothetical protein
MSEKVVSFPRACSRSLNDPDCSEDVSVSVYMTPEQPQRQELAHRETKAVNTLKIALLISLLIAAAGIATCVYVYTRGDETDEFKETFSEFSNLIIDTVQTNAQNRLEAVGALTTQIQAHAINSNSTWPFVTVPFFEEQVDVMKSLTDAFGVLLFPIVSDVVRAEWEAYSLQNVHWINESFAAQMDVYGWSDQLLPLPNETWFDVLWGEDYESDNNPDFSSGISDQIFGFLDDDNTDSVPIVHDTIDLYFPQWQVAPMSWYYQSTVNSNYGGYEDFLNSTLISIETGNAVLGVAWTDDLAPGYITTMIYPIFDKFHGDDRTVVAFLGADIFWQDYLTDILPNNAKGIYVVIENSLGEIFTYEIIGQNVEFIEDGDLHDKAYDSMEVTFLFGEHLQEPITSESYTGAPLYGGFIQYTFHIYPSQQLEDTYVTNRPIAYTVVTIAIFLFTAFIFVIYNCLVERRQKLVMNTAIKSDAIVSSLFPSQVKERLYENGEDKTVHGKESDDDGNDMMAKIKHPRIANRMEGPPIAELYEASTVFFAGKREIMLGACSD